MTFYNSKVVAEFTNDFLQQYQSYAQTKPAIMFFFCFIVIFYLSPLLFTLWYQAVNIGILIFQQHNQVCDRITREKVYQITLNHHLHIHAFYAHRFFM